MPGGDRGLVSWPARSTEFRDNLDVNAQVGATVLLEPVSRAPRYPLRIAAEIVGVIGSTIYEGISMSYLHQPAAAVTGRLQPRGQREGADSGDPQISWTGFDAADDVRVGVWEAEPGGWPVVNRPDTETCYIVSGRAAITDDATGEKQEITAGDVIVFPKGWSGRWDVTETIRKVYSIVVPATDG